MIFVANISVHKRYLFFLLFVGVLGLINGQSFGDDEAVVGLEFEHTIGDIENDGTWGTGAAWLDYDLDGDLDLYVTNRGGLNSFFENQLDEGNDFFSDIASDIGLACSGCDCAGVAVADYDNDGYPDIYLTTASGDMLFHNVEVAGSGERTYTNVSGILGGISGTTTRGTSVTWFDFDEDGYLDLYLSNHVPAEYHDGMVDTNDYLLHNVNGDFFEDASFLIDDFGLRWGSSFISGWTDFDDDGDFDLLVTNDCTHQWPVKQVFYENLGPSGSDWSTWEFDTITEAIGLDDCASAMGLAIADYDHDGDQDLAYSNIGDIRLWENDNGNFTDVAVSAGVAVQETGNYSWGMNFADLDNDMWVDLLVVSGYLGLGGTQNNLDTSHPNFYFNNDGDGSFSDYSASHNFDDINRGRTSAVGDYDNDGDLDVFIVNYDNSAQFKRNDLDNSNHYIKLDLEGVLSNRDGVGSKIMLRTPDGEEQYAESRSGSSLGAGDSPYLHFGLGSNESVELIRITWPSGTIQELSDIGVDTCIHILEDELLPSTDLILRGQVVSDGIELRWEDAAQTEFYHLEKRNHLGEYIAIAENLSVQSVVDTDPYDGSNYYRLRTETRHSSLIRVEYSSQAHLLYPQPASEMVYIPLSLRHYRLWKVASADGTFLTHRSIDSHGALELVDLTSGLYFISPVGEDSALSLRLLKSP